MGVHGSLVVHDYHTPSSDFDHYQPARVLYVLYAHVNSMSTQANDQARDLENGTDNLANQPRSSVPSLLFISIALFMLINGHGDDFASTRDMYVNGLQNLNYQLGNFSAWLNGTESNFTLVSLVSTVHEVRGPIMMFLLYVAYRGPQYNAFGHGLPPVWS